MFAFLYRHRYRFLFVLAMGIVAGCCLAWLAFNVLSGSLPPLDGTFRVEGISDEVRVERDGRGVPTLTGTSRADLAFALGFVHAQDRLFQMDLMRRHAAGELSELVGPAALNEDRRMRAHRFRTRARRALEASPPAEREFLTAYTRGVAAGRATLSRLPWEFLLLGAEFAEWREEDCILVGLEMYEQLQHGPPEQERMLGVMHDTLPPALVKFLTPAGSSWDEPFEGNALPGAPVPSEREVDLRRDQRWRGRPLALAGASEPARNGSNNWAVSGRRTHDGRAIVACDMHLGLRAPGTWYRASIVLGGRRVTGVTLPGAPAVVVGSNGDVAWGFTNAEADTSDLVVLEEAPGQPDHYVTPGGPRAIERAEETILVKGRAPVEAVIEETIWGPVVARDHKGRRLAQRWVAHDTGAVTLGLMQLENARSVKEALRLAPTFGVPAQNFVVADRDGHIGWTLLGRLPDRFGHDGRLPSSWADGKRGWRGFLPPARHPSVYDPPEGLLWTANNRTGDTWAALVGYGSADHGARARQIHQGLKARGRLSERDMLEVQLDDRALFLKRWRDVLRRTIERELAGGPDEQLEAMRRAVEDWGDRAAADSVGFRLVGRFRILARAGVLTELCGPCFRADKAFNAHYVPACVEDSVFQIVEDCPAHLRPAGATTSHAVAALRKLRAEVGPRVAAYTQGALNRGPVKHPLSPALGVLGRWMLIDMPDDELPGDRTAMPRIQGPRHGASERLAVSPGHEDEGYFHMPAGQSGHFLSPHYADGHDDWAQGRASPFLPGEAEHVIRLVPRG